MNTKTIVATLLGAITFFLMGWLTWGILLKGVMEQHSNAACDKPEEQINFVYMVIANLLWGYVYAYIFSNWNMRKTFSSGMVPGAIINVLIGLSFDLYMLALTNLSTSTTPMLVNIAPNAVIGALVGGIVCWWLGREKAVN